MQPRQLGYQTMEADMAAMQGRDASLTRDKSPTSADAAPPRRTVCGVVQQTIDLFRNTPQLARPSEDGIKNSNFRANASRRRGSPKKYHSGTMSRLVM